MDCPRSFKHQKIRKGWNIPIYCHFWYKSEYQLEEILIKHVVFSALSKTFPPLFNDNPQLPSGGGGLHEKVTQVLWRRKVMLCYDTNRFLNSCMFFEKFWWQNSHFVEKTWKNFAILGLNYPLWCSVQVCFRNQTNATASSFIPRFNCTQSMKESFWWPFPILLL